MHKPRIAIIGGGAAGLMVAATLAERIHNGELDAEVLLLEKNKELGNKIRISGGGRCNITTGYIKKKELESKYIRGWEFLSYAMSQFGPRKIAQRCADHGCPIYCQDDMRCFPVSNVGADVVAMFSRIIKDVVDVRFSQSVTGISHTSGPVSSSRAGGSFSITTTSDTITTDMVVITTGGNAYAHTGSSGDGYALAQALGHTITECGPSLNSFLVAEEWVKGCSGVSFVDAVVRMRPVSTKEETQKYTNHSIAIETQRPVSTPISRGPILLTHFGISGPATFAYSAQVPLIPIDSHHPHTILCQPFADRDIVRWTKHITDTTASHPKQQLTTLLSRHFPSRRCEAFARAHMLDGSLYLGNLTREQKLHIASLLGDGFPLTLTARRPGDEFVTAGGIVTSEVDSQTMESRLCAGLYFAGEVLNIDAVTGGFNFQACWATGRCAGEEIIKKARI